MRNSSKLVAAWLVTVVWMALALVPVAAENFDVGTTTYTKTATVGASDPFDTHELTAQNGQHVKYSMTTTGGCAELYFVKGHSVSPASQYYITYSQESCVSTYSNDFPVESSDGTTFTVMIYRIASPDASYTLTIETYTPAVPSWVWGLLIFILVLVVPGIIGMVIRSRRRAKAAQPAMPPPEMPPPPAPPQL